MRIISYVNRDIVLFIKILKFPHRCLFEGLLILFSLWHPQASTYAKSKGSESTQDGPSMPIFYLTKPKHVHYEAPWSANSLPSFSLAVGLSSTYKEYFQQDDVECTKFNSTSLFLGKPGRGPQSVLKFDSTDGPGAFATGSMPKISLSKTVTIQQPNVYQNIPVPSIPHAFSFVNSTLCLQSCRNI